jgi:hypothetical protein
MTEQHAHLDPPSTSETPATETPAAGRGLEAVPALAARERGPADEQDFAQARQAASVARSHTRRLSPPYVGLRSFAERDHEFFFGRAEEVRRLRNMLEAGRLAAVVGPPKSGRTSLLEAGLAGLLSAGSTGSDVSHPWLIGRLDLAATEHALDAALRLAFEQLAADEQLVEFDAQRGAAANAERARLVSASLDTASDAVVRATQHLLAGTGARLLFMIDNFDAVVADAHAGEFVAQLLEATNRAGVDFYLALAIRDGALGSCGEFAGLGSALAGRTLVLERPTFTQLEEMIRGPARVANWSVSRALVSQLLRDCSTWTHPMAELQYALARMSGVAAQTGQLDLTSYAAVGCPNAIAAHAEELLAGNPSVDLDALSAREQELTHDLFISLVDFRQFAAEPHASRFDELAEHVGVEVDDPEFRRLVRRFSDAGFLRVFGDSAHELGAAARIELSHPLLLERWPRLAQWLREDSKHGQTLLSLVGGALRQREVGVAALLRGPELERAQRWIREFAPTRRWAERHCDTSRWDTTRWDTADSQRHAEDWRDPIALVRTYIERSAEEEQAQRRAIEQQQQAQREAQRRAKHRLAFVIAAAALVTAIGGVVLASVTQERDEALSESEMLELENAAVERDKARLQNTESQLRESLADAERQIVSLQSQLEVLESERTELAESGEALAKALRELQERQRHIVFAHDKALREARASREALARVRAELAIARGQGAAPDPGAAGSTTPANDPGQSPSVVLPAAP